jgi:hypothetical protein
MDDETRRYVQIGGGMSIDDVKRMALLLCIE